MGFVKMALHQDLIKKTIQERKWKRLHKKVDLPLPKRLESIPSPTFGDVLSLPFWELGNFIPRSFGSNSPRRRRACHEDCGCSERIYSSSNL
ncbi:unnamed protein product [Ilex paraguariensis]|uniref:Uncharacterized protein n=1 Tax=Ilex paraguariensis TaxID=185542 RepID=A0ABC8RZA5_9AQUA